MKLLAISTSCFTASNRVFYHRLQDDGINTTIFIPSIWDFGKGIVNAEPSQSDDPAIVFLKPTNFHHRLYRLEGVLEKANEVSPDVIYYEGDPGSMMAALLGRYARKKKIRFLALSCENLSQSPLAVIKREGIKEFPSAVVKYLLIQYSRTKIDSLFVINNKGFNYFKRLGFESVIQTPLGFNEEVFNINNEKRIRIRSKLDLNSDTIVIAYFGRLVYEKGVHLLIEALGKSKIKNWVFLIDKFGRYKTEYQSNIEKLIMQSDFESRTIFFEADHIEIADYMNASDITILPSIPTKKWIEQYGRVVPEAKACGNLVIVSNVGAPKDFFEKQYPFIFQSESVEDLIEKIGDATKTLKESNYNRKLNSEETIRQFSLTAQIEVFKSVLDDFDLS